MSAQRLGDNLATRRQGDHLVDTAGEYHRADAGTDRGEGRPVHLLDERLTITQLRAADESENQHHQHIGHDDQGDDSEGEQHDQQRRVLAHPLLRFEEVHR
ncbi:MAG TPA: hypothetical protein PLC86_03110 [Candidatus Accumulibacter phosphatis]|nr:hypothetical protein [Candidatus Accumulibacter phosphatis]